VPPADGTDAETTPPTVEAPPRAYFAGIATAGLAAVCGAIFTSWLGAQGTLAGAMIGATIGSSVSEIVKAPLTSLEQRIIQAGVSARQVRRDGLLMTVMSSPAAARQVFGMVSRRAVATVAMIAVAGFALAMGGVTAVEVASGAPLSDIVADADFSDTTLGQTLPPPAFLAPEPQRPAVEATAQEGVDADGPRAGASPSPASETGGLPGMAPSPSPEGSQDDDGNVPPDAAASPEAGSAPEPARSPERPAASTQAAADGSSTPTHTPSVTAGATSTGATTPAPTPIPASTPTVTNTPVTGAATPAAPPATLPPPPQT
jgi:hypothetical protein